MGDKQELLNILKSFFINNNERANSSANSGIIDNLIQYLQNMKEKNTSRESSNENLMDVFKNIDLKEIIKLLPADKFKGIGSLGSNFGGLKTNLIDRVLSYLQGLKA